MSWAANNVEAYDECERNAVVDLLAKSLVSNGFYMYDEMSLNAFVEVLQSDFPKIFQLLASGSDVSAAIADYQITHSGADHD